MRSSMSEHGTPAEKSIRCCSRRAANRAPETLTTTESSKAAARWSRTPSAIVLARCLLDRAAEPLDALLRGRMRGKEVGELPDSPPRLPSAQLNEESIQRAHRHA